MVVVAFFVEHEPGVAQPGEVAGDGVLGHPEVGRDPAHVGGGDQAAVVVDAGVQGDVFQDRPGHHPNGTLDLPG